MRINERNTSRKRAYVPCQRQRRDNKTAQSVNTTMRQKKKPELELFQADARRPTCSFQRSELQAPLRHSRVVLVPRIPLPNPGSHWVEPQDSLVGLPQERALLLATNICVRRECQKKTMCALQYCTKCSNRKYIPTTDCTQRFKSRRESQH